MMVMIMSTVSADYNLHIGLHFEQVTSCMLLALRQPKFRDFSQESRAIEVCINGRRTK